MLIDPEGGIIAGHGRVLAARQLEMDQIPTICLSGLSETQRRAYRITDNQMALNAGWDPELLRLGELELDGFDLSLTGFDDLQLGELLADRTEGRTDPDDVPAAPEHPATQPGDLWIMGRHRLLCGDSTIATDVERVLGGVTPHLMVTDPPYGVNYDPAWRNRAAPLGGGFGGWHGGGFGGWHEARGGGGFGGGHGHGALTDRLQESKSCWSQTSHAAPLWQLYLFPPRSSDLTTSSLVNFSPIGRKDGHLRAVAAGLRRHGRDNAVAGALQQVPDEGAADAEPSTMKSRTPR